MTDDYYARFGPNYSREPRLGDAPADPGPRHEHGPEWWAKGDTCRCGHGMAEHHEVITSTPGAYPVVLAEFPCIRRGCGCVDFDPAS